MESVKLQPITDLPQTALSKQVSMYLPCSDQSVSVFANLKIVGNTLNAVLASLEATAKEEMTSKDFEGAIESGQKKVDQHLYSSGIPHIFEGT